MTRRPPRGKTGTEAVKRISPGRYCVTHHHACDCREERFRQTEAQLAEARRLLGLCLKAMTDGEIVREWPHRGIAVEDIRSFLSRHEVNGG